MPSHNPTDCQPHDDEEWARCRAYQQASELLGRRWTGMILYALLPGPQRFNALLRSVYGISDRLLTERLRELEEKGLVARHVIAESPIRAEYSLTESGRDAEEIMAALFRWGNKWLYAAPEKQ